MLKGENMKKRSYISELIYLGYEYNIAESHLSDTKNRIDEEKKDFYISQKEESRKNILSTFESLDKKTRNSLLSRIEETKNVCLGPIPKQTNHCEARIIYARGNACKSVLDIFFQDYISKKVSDMQKIFELDNKREYNKVLKELKIDLKDSGGTILQQTSQYLQNKKMENEASDTRANKAEEILFNLIERVQGKETTFPTLEEIQNLR